MIKVRSRDEAVKLIEARVDSVIDLDYENGSRDLQELSILGRKHLVGLLWRSQENILVQDLGALRTGLSLEKTTQHARNLFCAFDLTTVPEDELWKLQTKAASLGDSILPGTACAHPGEAWTS